MRDMIPASQLSSRRRGSLEAIREDGGLSWGLPLNRSHLAESRAHWLGHLRRQVTSSVDTELAHPCDDPKPEIELPGPGNIVVPLRIRYGDRKLAFFSTLATFGTPLDITIAELTMESFFPPMLTP